MKCRVDISQDIRDEINKRVAEDKNIISEAGEHVVSLKGRTKGEAYDILNRHIDTLNRDFSEYKYGAIASIAEYEDALHLQIHPSKALIDAYTAKFKGQVKGEEKGEYFSAEDGEDYFQPATDETEGENTPPPVGIYKKFIAYKEELLKAAYQHLSAIKSARRNAEDIRDEKEKEKRLRELNIAEAELNHRINGSEDLGKVGLKEEINRLKAKPLELAVRDYMEADLKRLESLSKSPTIESLPEAKEIINFIKAAGSFVRTGEGLWRGSVDPSSGKFNPFFEKEDDTAYFEAAIEPFRKWMERAKEMEIIFQRLGRTLVTDEVNNSPKVKRMYGSLSLDQLTQEGEGLKDTHWIDMWTMDVSNGIFGGNGYLPQIMLDELEKAVEAKTAWARDIEHRVNKILSPVEKILGDKGHKLAKFGILGAAGVSYDLFRQRTANGRLTGRLVNRYSDKFFRDREGMEQKYLDDIKKANLEDNPIERTKKIVQAIKDRRGWFTKNVNILDITKLPEVINHPDFQGFASRFKGEGESEEYKKALIEKIGKAAYDEEVSNQINLIRKYKTDEAVFRDTFLASHGVTTVDELSEKAKVKLGEWILKASPFSGLEDFTSPSGIRYADDTDRVYNYMNYNVTIPKVTREYEDVMGNKVKEETGYWDGQFKEIEDSPELKEFHSIVSEVTKTMRDNMPESLFNQSSFDSIPALRRTIIEMLTDPNVSALKRVSSVVQELYNRIRNGWGIVQHGDMSYVSRDTITGKLNYQVNDTFMKGNISKISGKMLLEKRELIPIINAIRAERGARGIPLKDISKNYTIKLSDIDPSSTSGAALLSKIADYLGSPSPDVKEISKVNGGNEINLHNIIKEAMTHEVAQEQSFDMPKIAKYFAHLTMEYAARQQVQPALQLMKEHYEGIKNKTKIGGQEMVSDGLRGNAIRQMDDWFNRVALGNYNKEDFGVSKVDEEETKKEKMSRMAKLFTGQWVNKKFYVGEDKATLKRVDDLLEHEQDPEAIKKLEKVKEGLGRTLALSAAMDNFLNFTRLKGLGYNLSAALTNFIQGTESNIILAATGEYFQEGLIYPAYNIVRANFMASTITGGFKKTYDGRKTINLMERYRVLQDSSNELQRSSVKTNFSWTRNLSAYDLVRRVEFVNQSPLMIAMLMDRKVTGKDGAISSVWDAMDKEGRLSENFATDENKFNWEEQKGDEYNDFKGSLKKAVVKGHGNYDDKRGMMIKSSAIGKAIMMFKTWIPHAVYQRIAKPQDDMASGIKNFKGRYRSFTPMAGGVYGAIVGTSFFGPIIGAPVGFAVGALQAKRRGAQSDTGMMWQLGVTGFNLAKKMIGLPVNLLSGRNLIKTSDDFKSFVGQRFTEQDAANLRANIADMAMLMSYIVMTLMAKMALWDDDDDKDSVRRRTHNLLVNRFTQLISQAEMFVNPRAAWAGTIGDMSLLKWYDDIKNLAMDAEKARQGDDVIVSGSNAGGSKLWQQTKRTFVPGIFKDGNPVMEAIHGHAPTFGFESQMERQFPDAASFPMNRWFQGEEKTDKRDNQETKASHKAHLEEEGYEGDDLKRQMKEDVGRGKKHGETNKEYKEYLDERKQEWGDDN